MMMSHDDRRRLQEIERQLEREDPGLARGMRQAWPRARQWPCVVLVVVGALLVLLGTAVLSAGLVMVGLAVAIGGIVLLRKRRSRQDRPRSE